MAELAFATPVQFSPEGIKTLTASSWLESIIFQFITFTFGLILFEILFPYFINFLKTSKHFELNDLIGRKQKGKVTSITSALSRIVNFVQFKYVITATFTFFWLGLLTYSLSFINLHLIWHAFSSQFTVVFLFKILGLMAAGYSSIILIIPVLICSKIFWFSVFILALVSSLVITLLGLKKPSGFISSVLGRFTPDYICALVSSVELELKEAHEAVSMVNQLIGTLSSYLSLPSIIFTIQLILLSNIRLNVKMPLYVVLPLLFLTDWTFNFYLSITKFSTYLLIDKHNFNKSRQEKFNNYTLRPDDPTPVKLTKFESTISYNTLIKNAPIICMISLQLTVFSFLDFLSKTVHLMPYSSFPPINYMIKALDSAKSYIGIIFRIADNFTENRIFFLALVNSHLETNPEVEIQKFEESISENEISEKDSRFEYLASISSKVFSSNDSIVMKIIWGKNFLIKLAFQITIFCYSVLGFDEIKILSPSHLDQSSEPLHLLALIFQKINFTSICVFLFFIFLINYLLAFESAYIMNKKPEAEKKIKEELKKKAEGQIETIAPDKTIMGRAVDYSFKIFRAFKRFSFKPNEYVNVNRQEGEVDSFPPFEFKKVTSDNPTEEVDVPSDYFDVPETFIDSEGNFTFD